MIKNDLLKRMNMNKDRLMDDLYSYPLVFNQNSSWKGDFEGRAFLGLNSLYKGFEGDKKTQQVLLERINMLYSHLKEFTNDDFYFGDIFDEKQINEQDLAGNSWFIRGLCLYYENTNNAEVYNKIVNIQNKYLIRLCECYKTYPINKRSQEGAVGGYLISDNQSNWILSSDVGCAFISLDCLTSVYELTKNEKLYLGIKEAIKAFMNIDYISLECQTHATLSCARAILRFYQCTNEKEYLDYAIGIFDKYLEYGMTLDYQNKNWFKRDDCWTEPCCIVDSWIISKQLFEITKNDKYLSLYNKIVFNGLLTFQRSNGGAGCSTLLLNNKAETHMFLYEAFFCCSMRLGEGMRYIADNLVNDGGIYKLLLTTGFECSDFDLDFDLYNSTTGYIKAFNDSKIDIYVPNGFKLNKQINQFSIKGNHLIITLKKDEEIHFEFNLCEHTDNDYHFLGDILLTKKNIDSSEYSLPINSSLYSEDELKTFVQYIK